MKITLGSNIASLKGQRQLAKTSGELATVFERLSSGQRINRASDDAAGLAIADSLNANSRIFNQGVRNLNDGLSLLNIADAAIENLSSIMIRLEELAEQAANGVYGSKQRKALDAEAQALSREFSRITQSTKFNGSSLLNGENTSVALQAGVGIDAIINASVGGVLGTGAFESRETVTVSGTPSGLASGDFNGDGNLDLVTADYATFSIQVFLGQGNGSFAQGVSYGAGGGITAVATGDLNGDGILDIVTADTANSSVSVLLGRGDGTFANRTSYTVGGQPRAVTLGDFNGDGRLDLATADGADSTASVLIGRGDGSFNTSTTYQTGGTPYALISADFNNDGKLDLVSADSGTNSVSVLIGNGNGTFAARISFTLNFGALPRSVATGDFNGDGFQDLAIAEYGFGDVKILVGTGKGTFQERASYSPLDFSGNRSITAVDFNGDGILDLVNANSGNATVGVMLGVGNGTFGSSTSYSMGTTPRTVISGDFNGDGVPDLVTADFGSNSLSIRDSRTRDGIHPLLPFSLKTLADARQALPVLKRKRELLAEQRGEIGAFQSRIDVAVNVLYAASENFKAAESRIRDADIAAESSQLVRTQILQQAASAVLAQANQQPALVLQLLG